MADKERDGTASGEAGGEMQRLRQANAAIADALRSIESMTWLDIEPASEPVQVCQLLVGKIIDAGDMRQLGVFLMNDETLQFEHVLTVPDFVANRVKAEFEEQLAAGMVGWTVRERRLVAVPPITPSPTPSESVIMFPISTPRRIWGLVLCFSPQRNDELPQNALRLLAIVANYIGMAVENASLMRALADQNRNLERIVQERSAQLLAKTAALEDANAELRRQDAQKNDFISLVAHELRTPLTSLLSFSEFLQEEGLSQDEVREFGGSIQREAVRLHRLVNDVLDLAKMEAGKLIYHYADDDLNEVAGMCITSMRGAAQARSIALQIESDPALPRVRFARDRVQQVILNMLSNAIKFSEPNGKIILSTRDGGDGVCLSVQDFGVGIAARDIPKVFNKFEQIQEVKHHGEGTGFGMPIAKNIIESGHGGTMWVESAGRGKGTTFYFTLPKAAAGQRASGLSGA